jgi:hypothetical protein
MDIEFENCVFNQGNSALPYVVHYAIATHSDPGNTQEGSSIHFDHGSWVGYGMLIDTPATVTGGAVNDFRIKDIRYQSGHNSLLTMNTAGGGIDGVVIDNMGLGDPIGTWPLINIAPGNSFPVMNLSITGNSLTHWTGSLFNSNAPQVEGLFLDDVPYAATYSLGAQAGWSWNSNGQTDTSLVGLPIGPITVPYATQNIGMPAAWNLNTTYTNVAGPDGLNNGSAVHIPGPNTYTQNQLWSMASGYAVGDWVIWGGWVKADYRVVPGYYQLVLNGGSAISLDNSQNIQQLSTVSTDGAWYFVSKATKITDIATGALNFSFNTGSSTGTSIAYPFAVYVPASAGVPDAEIVRWQRHMLKGIVPSSAAAGTTSAIPVAFSSVTSATNTSAAMLVGTGASLAPTGSGTITATTAASATTATTATMAGNVSGTVAIGNGGTGQSTQQAAMNALAGTQTAGQFLRGNGSNVAMSAIQASDVPTLNQNTTGSAAMATTAGTATTANTAAIAQSLAQTYTYVSTGTYTVSSVSPAVIFLWSGTTVVLPTTGVTVGQEVWLVNIGTGSLTITNNGNADNVPTVLQAGSTVQLKLYNSTQWMMTGGAGLPSPAAYLAQTENYVGSSYTAGVGSAGIVFMYSPGPLTLPTGLAAGVEFWVVNLGSSAITITNNGSADNIPATIPSGQALQFKLYSSTQWFVVGGYIGTTGNVLLDASTNTLTNKTFDTGGAGNVLKINGAQVSAVTGTGAAVLASSPTLVSPVLGAASATSLNASGNVTGSTLSSTVATGTAPFAVTSTTPVANLSIGGNAATASTATSATAATLATTAATAMNVAGGALGAVHYQSAANTTAMLAGNTSATPAVLMQTGTGSASAAPVWTAATGTGSPALSVSPTFTGTVGAAAISATSVKLSSGSYANTWATNSLTGSYSFTTPNGASYSVMPASLTTTSATSDAVIVQGMASSGHCSLTATNSTAAANHATTYVSAKTTNQITVTHTATAGMTYDVICTSN